MIETPVKRPVSPLRLTISALLCLGLIGGIAPSGLASAPSREDLPAIAPGPFQPTAESLKTYQYPDWFRDSKLGIWAHWGPQAVPMFGDWYARQLYQQGGP